jgi:hypothetical protein
VKRTVKGWRRIKAKLKEDKKRKTQVNKKSTTFSRFNDFNIYFNKEATILKNSLQDKIRVCQEVRFYVAGYGQQQLSSYLDTI